MCTNKKTFMLQNVRGKHLTAFNILQHGGHVSDFIAGTVVNMKPCSIFMHQNCKMILVNVFSMVQKENASDSKSYCPITPSRSRSSDIEDCARGRNPYRGRSSSSNFTSLHFLHFKLSKVDDTVT